MLKTGEEIPAIQVLGTRVHMVQCPEVLQQMERWIEERQRCHYMVVSNMHAVIEARKDPSFSQVVNSADLFVPDGISVIRVARRRGFPLKERVCGTDLIWGFSELANRKGYRSFLYGDTDEVLAHTTQTLQRHFPQLSIAGSYSPPFRPLTPEEDEDIIDMINRANPDVLWVGLGCPKQERWMFEHREKLNVPVVAGVGAAFKFVSGTVVRAPEWVQDFHLEWIWRFLQEPKRIWRRVFLYTPEFLFSTFLETRRLRRVGRPFF